MSGYSHRAWQCPYFQSDDKLLIRCEGGRVAMPDQEAMSKYGTKYCASSKGRHSCPLAACLEDYYERTDTDE